MMKGLKVKILNNILGKTKFQRLFQTLLELSLTGLNYGNGGDFKKSGELYVLKYVKERFNVEKQLIIFDVGGNIGAYAKVLADFFNEKAIIHAFEPSKKAFEVLFQTMKDTQNTVINNFGLSDTNNTKILYTDFNGSGLASLYKRNLEHFGITMGESEQVKLLTIDSYCQTNNIDHIHFLKLDVEGHELKVLNGAKQMLNNKKIDIIQFEFGGCNIDSRTYFQDFFYCLKDNYRIYRVLKDGLFEISTYKESYEIFMTVNYLAVSKS